MVGLWTAERSDGQNETNKQIKTRTGILFSIVTLAQVPPASPHFVSDDAGAGFYS